MAGKICKEDGSVALPVGTLPLSGQVFAGFWTRERIWKNKHDFVNSNTVIQLEQVQILIFNLKYAGK